MNYASLPLNLTLLVFFLPAYTFGLEPGDSADEIYKKAAALLKEGKKELAEESAKRAFAMRPDDAQAHVVSAFLLQKNGLFEWSEREYRYVLMVAKNLTCRLERAFCFPGCCSIGCR